MKDESGGKRGLLVGVWLVAEALFHLVCVTWAVILLGSMVGGPLAGAAGSSELAEILGGVGPTALAAGPFVALLVGLVRGLLRLPLRIAGRSVDELPGLEPAPAGRLVTVALALQVGLMVLWAALLVWLVADPAGCWSTVTGLLFEAPGGVLGWVAQAPFRFAVMLGFFGIVGFGVVGAAVLTLVRQLPLLGRAVRALRWSPGETTRIRPSAALEKM